MSMEERIIQAKPYLGKYPSAAAFLISEGIISKPKQTEPDLYWATGVDIEYKIKKGTPKVFEEYSDSLLLLALQECSRYPEALYKFAVFNVKVGKLKKGKDIPDIASFTAAMHTDADVMIYGEEVLGYKVPGGSFLKTRVDDILGLTERYLDRISKQQPFKVISLVISLRQPHSGRVEGASTKKPAGPSFMERFPQAKKAKPMPEVE